MSLFFDPTDHGISVADVVGSLFPDDWKETRVFLTTAELEREDMGFVKDGWMDLLIRVAVLGTEGTNPVTTSHVADPYVIRPQRRVLDPEPGTLMRVRGMFVRQLPSLSYSGGLDQRAPVHAKTYNTATRSTNTSTMPFTRSVTSNPRSISFHCRVQCRVHRSLLNSTAKVIWTAPFELDYRQWCIPERLINHRPY